MKTKFFLMVLAVTATLSINSVQAGNEKRDVQSFSEISLRVPGTLYLTQGSPQSVEISAKESVLKDLITEVKDRKLIIRFPTTRYFWKNNDAGSITIRVTMPEIDGLNISGSGDIVAEEKIKSRILDLNISGSGNIKLDDLEAERIMTGISGSGDILIKSGGPADDMSASISGSGNINASGFEADNISVKIAGSGNCSVNSNGSISVKIAGSGDVYYSGNPSVESSVAGSGGVRKAR